MKNKILNTLVIIAFSIVMSGATVLAYVGSFGAPF
jgi:hypothetical protein